MGGIRLGGLADPSSKVYKLRIGEFIVKRIQVMGGTDSEISDTTHMGQKGKRGGGIIEEYKACKREILDQSPQELSELRTIPVSRSIDQPIQNPPRDLSKNTERRRRWRPDTFDSRDGNSEFPKWDNVSDDGRFRDDRGEGLRRQLGEIAICVTKSVMVSNAHNFRGPIQRRTPHSPIQAQVNIEIVDKIREYGRKFEVYFDRELVIIKGLLNEN